MRNPLSAEDHKRIRDAASAVEQRTDAKISIVITRVSERYTLYTIGGAALGAMVAGGLAISARPALNGRTLIFVELCALVALIFLLDVLPIRLAIMPARIKQASARNLAHREFAAHAMGADSDRKRILLFVSLGERYVEVIADHATHALAPPGTWNRIVDDLVASVRSGRIADGIVSAIESCDALLPPRGEAPEGQ
ncbi:MAG TPA: TPM domain-containing protein [Candidatus Binataceae bacterium]|nr:TPM domain-containing protein [Candidatus Binataceae bacterium]